MARGLSETFTGKIDGVSAEIEEVDGRYRVWATVDNHQKNGYWVLSPGMIASMTINVDVLKAAERVAPSGGTR